VARELLEVVGRVHKAAPPAGSLTPSEQRRLDLARALATRPRLLLLDEVAAGFSPVAVKQAVDLVRRVQERGVTIFVIDHFLNLSLRVSNRLLALDLGEKLAEGLPPEVMRNREVIRAYLGLRHEDEND
jgi:branched-chain amino acid transport system ATP-binding protein